MKFSPWFFAAALLWAHAAAADEATTPPRCRPYDLPIELKFIVAPSTPAVRDTLSLTEIEDRARAEGIKDESRHTFGITVAESVVSLDTVSHALRYAAGECIYLDQVKANFTWRVHDMYVANRFHAGECMYDAVLAHERAHANINDAVVEAYAPRIKAALEEALTHETPNYQEKFSGTAVREALARLDASIAPLMAAFQEEKAARNATIDTPEMRRAVMESCRDGARPAPLRTAKGSQAVIPSARDSGIVRWIVGNDKTIYLQDRRRKWFRADLQERCPGLSAKPVIGFTFAENGDFDYRSEIRAGTTSCPLASLVAVTAPPGG